MADGIVVMEVVRVTEVEEYEKRALQACDIRLATDLNP
jgi:hypothetical protein